MRNQSIVAIFLLLSMGVQAQFLKFGLKGGANLVKISGVSFQDGYDLGYYAGIFTEMKLGEKWYLQPEIQFGETSLTYSEDFEDIYENLLDISKLSDLKLQRLSIPITINYKIANILSFSAGPQFSIITDKQSSLLQNAGNAFSDGDIGIIGGANIMIGKFRVNGRYIWGLKDMNNIDGKDPWKAQTAQLGVGFVF
jgi:hypothetical protein